MTDPSTNEASKLELLELQNDLLELIEVTQGSLENPLQKWRITMRVSSSSTQSISQ